MIPATMLMHVWRIIGTTLVVNSMFHDHHDAIQKTIDLYRAGWEALKRKQARVAQSSADFLEQTFRKSRSVDGRTGRFSADMVQRIQEWRTQREASSTTTLQVHEALGHDADVNAQLLGLLTRFRPGLLEGAQVDDPATQAWDYSGFIVGGPAPNPVAKDYLDLLRAEGIPIGFADGSAVPPITTPLDKHRRTILGATLDAEIRNGSDHGLLVRVPNRGRPQESVVLLMGPSRYGTRIAAAPIL